MLFATHSCTLSSFLQLISLPDYRIALCLDWICDPGRKPGCYDALPYGSYGTCIERSFDETKAEFDQYWQEWESSQAKIELQENMAQIIKQQNDLANVVSFGTGTLQEPFLRTRRRSCLQIAALLTMTRCISMEAVLYFRELC